MKNLIIGILLSIPFVLFAQETKEFDFVSNQEDGFSTVRQGGNWGFINTSGELLFELRNDLVTTDNPKSGKIGVAGIKYPQLKDERAIISKKKDGVNYYGFINTEGKTVIEPEFLNVSNFSNGKALALKLEEERLGKNQLLGKGVISYKYDVVLIDKAGEVVTYLEGPFPVAVSKKKLREAPAINAKWLGEKVVSVKGPNGKWKIHKL
ncbi:WG repeat-containing protein [Salegentibacter salegens]|uniref:WG containing repeat-containing protein n=1 Tax=Salegentibacter salegens TaxID=143223 RepID=A0A1M7HHT4_9FLAO|nr:WG repeat-containing protein [Salegentibacter salegens]PRX44075.1 WG repeat protein [Salegentibacter salegens]SHM27707.1 WG containing repeat-containing protein [Salegentibacter salegens]